MGLEERDGLLVREVEDDSPAAKAGIAEGDLIVAAAGRPVASADDLFDALGSVGAGAPLEADPASRCGGADRYHSRVSYWDEPTCTHQDALPADGHPQRRRLQRVP